jgi:hypothetical protein
VGVGSLAPFQVFAHMMRVRCSLSVWVAASRVGGRPRPVSFKGRCTPSVGKLGRRFIAFLMFLLSMPSMVVICLSLNTPRGVAWYLDLRSCYTASVLRD